jgi:hypothetical protein
MYIKFEICCQRIVDQSTFEINYPMNSRLQEYLYIFSYLAFHVVRNVNYNCTVKFYYHCKPAAGFKKTTRGATNTENFVKCYVTRGQLL